MATRIEVSITVRGDKNKIRHSKTVAEMAKYLGLGESVAVRNYETSTHFYQTFASPDQFYDTVTYAE